MIVDVSKGVDNRKKNFIFVLINFNMQISSLENELFF